MAQHTHINNVYAPQPFMLLGEKKLTRRDEGEIIIANTEVVISKILPASGAPTVWSTYPLYCYHTYSEATNYAVEKEDKDHY
jgi:hypothetical protein